MNEETRLGAYVDRQIATNDSSDNVEERLVSPDEDEDEESEERVADCGCPCGRHWSYLEEQVARYEIQKRSEACCRILICGKIPEHWYGRHSIHGIYLIFTLTFSLFLVISIYMWMIMCSECLHILRFESSDCNIQNVSVDQTLVCGCRLSAARKSSACIESSCVNITVQYHTKENAFQISTLFETLEHPQGLSEVCSIITPTCDEGSTSPTSSSYLSQVQESWGLPGHTLACKYDPAEPSTVILSSDYARKQATMIFSLLTTSFASICIMVMTVAASMCGCRFIWSKRAPPYIKEKVRLERDRQRINILESRELLTLGNKKVPINVC